MTAGDLHTCGLVSGDAYCWGNDDSGQLGNGATAGNQPSPLAVVWPGPPGAPSDVVAAAGDGKADVSWSAPGSDGDNPISGYTVTSTPGGNSASVGGSARSATVSGLTNGTSYTFTVTAANAVGTGASSVASNAVTPAGVPGEAGTVSAVRGDGSAVVGWSAASGNGSPVTGYTVTSSPGGHSANVGASATSATVSGLAKGTSYTFTVAATNAVGNGAASVASNAVTPAGVPGKAGSVSAVRGDGSAVVGWSAAAANGSPVTGYTVTSWPGGHTASVGGSATSATVTGLTNGTSYTFTVTATNALGNGLTSHPSNAVTPMDETTPALSVVSQPAALVRSRSASFGFSASDASGPVTTECSLDGGAFASCSSPATVAGLGDGDHTWRSVRVTRRATSLRNGPARGRSTPRHRQRG